jgi:hypothetical protein
MTEVNEATEVRYDLIHEPREQGQRNPQTWHPVAQVATRELVEYIDTMVGKKVHRQPNPVRLCKHSHAESVPESVVINPLQGEVREIVNLGGVAVDEINVNIVGTVAATPTPSEDSSGGAPTSASGGSLSQCSQIMGLPGGYVYKTVGSHHFTDVRRNTIGVVIKPGARGPFPSCVSAIDTKGNLVAKLALYSTGAGWAARYYAGVGCATGTPLNGAAVAAKARAQSGSSKIYLNFGGNCYGPIEGAVCIGSAHC